MRKLLVFFSFCFISLQSAQADYILSYSEIKKMSSAKRNAYLRSISKELILMSPRKKFSFLDLFFNKASADTAFRCIGGGIPVPAGGSCGVQSYAGYSCPEGQQICNPLIFGIYTSGEPVCFPRATTALCYQSTRVGTNTTTDPVFNNPESVAAYNEFSQQINGICSSLDGGSSSVQVEENPATLRAACHQVRRQTEVNRERSLVGYTGEGPGASDSLASAVPSEVTGDPQQVDPNANGGDVETSAVTGIQADPNNPCTTPQLTQRVPSQGNGQIPSFQSSSGPRRDAQVLDAVRAGNIPQFLKQLVPVRMRASRQCQGQTGDIVICTMPDYLAVGNDQNYVHTPLGLTAAMNVARDLGFMLPTTQMVDQIHSQANVKVSPSPRTANSSMTTSAVFTEHSRSVQRDLSGRSGLRSGHKKDLVITNRLAGTNFRNVAIYGWHRSNGRPIQSLYLGHGADYADYSHGIRLISQTAFINGRSYSLQELLRDPNCASALSNEGPMRNEVLNRFGNSAVEIAPTGGRVTDPVESSN